MSFAELRSNRLVPCQILVAAGMVLSLITLNGCQSSTSFGPTQVKGQSVSGDVHGGQQSVSGALIQLYAVGAGGDGTAASPLISATVTTSDGTGTMDANANAGNANNTLPAGSFTITGDFTCPAGAQVYITATGGNPGMAAGTNNQALALMAFLGSCANLQPSTTLQINELTTVGSLAPISAYTTSFGSIASGSSDASQFASAYGQVAEYVNVNTGTLPGPSLPAGYYASSNEIQTLADIVAGCINSGGGAAGTQTICGQLFTLATPTGGVAPTNTIAAIANILNHPTQNVAAIFNLLGSSVPYLPVLGAAPSSWQLPILQIPATPTFSPGSGTYVGTQSISINEVTFGVSVYYTTDGSTPTTSSSLYSSSLTVAANETINAIASYAGRANSPVASASYVITAPPAAGTPTFSVAAGTYASSQTVAISSTTAGAFIYYTTDGSTPTASSAFYSGPITVYETETVKAIAISSSTSTSAVGSAAYVITTYFNTISTFAGDGIGGYNGDGVAATAAELNYPYGTAVDGAGNVYIADLGNSRVRKVSTAGTITTIAGTGTAGYLGDGVAASGTEFSEPSDVKVDGSGNIYVDDDYNFRIRKINSSGIVSTIAGTGVKGFAGDGGAATSASISYSCGILLDNSSNLYIVDCANNRIRKVSAAGVITTIAGTGVTAYNGDNIQATAANLNDPEGIAMDQGGNLYIADLGNNRIRKVTPAGVISTYAGTGTAGFSGDNGPATSATLSSPEGLATDAAGNLYIADSGNNRVRVVTPAGVISTLAGSGTSSFSGDGGPASAATLYFPANVSVDAAGNVYITDNGNQRVRKISFAATAPMLAAPSFSVAGGTYNGTQYVSLSTTSSGAAIYYTTDNSTPTASSTLYSSLIAVSASETIKAIAIQSGFASSTVSSATYTITNLPSAAAPTFSPAPGSYASGQSVTLTASSGAAIYYTTNGTVPTTSSTLYSGAITVSSSETIYAVAAVSGDANSSVAEGGYYINQGTGIITTIAGNGMNGSSGDGGPATSAELYYPRFVAVDSNGNTYIADQDNQRIRKVTAAGVISTIAGNGTAGFSGDGGLATSAELFYPTGVAVDASGNVYIADEDNSRIRKVNTSGVISTIAGNGGSGSTGDGGLATAAAIGSPQGIAIDLTGNVYFADSSNDRVRKINTAGVITTVAGNGTQGFAGDGGAATSAELDAPTGVAVDSTGNLYISDQYNSRIRKVNPAGIITTYAGSGGSGYAGDGGAATSASLDYPVGVAVDGAGNVYISDSSNARIREVSAAGVISTIAGSGYSYSASFSGDGGPATSATLASPQGVAVDLAGNVYIADSSNERVRKISYSMAFQASAPVFSLAAGSYTAVQYLSIYSATPGAAIYYTTDMSTPTASSTLYATPIAVSTSETVTAIAIAPGYSNSATTAVAYTVMVEPTLAAPAFSPAAGTFSATQMVTLTASPSTAAIYYTTDGSTPTTSSSLYSGAITVSSTETINAITVLSGYNTSSVASGGFYISPTPGIISTFAGDGGYNFSGDGSAATSATIYYPRATAVDSQGNVYIADYDNSRVRKVSAATGIITTIAGNGTAGYSGDNGLAVNAELNYPQGVTLDSAGNVYIADTGNARIRKINTAGVITTIAGNGTAGFAGDSGSALTAELNGPESVAIDNTGNLYIADYSNSRIRKVTPAGVITTVAGTSSIGYNGDNIAATTASLDDPDAVAVDSAGNIYIADYYNYRIRKVTVSTGIISTYAGGGGYGFAGDGGTAASTSTKMSYPTSVAVDSAGNVYFTDSSNYRIRVINAAGVISTTAGNGTEGFSGDLGAATSAEISYGYGLSADSKGNLYFSDTTNQRVRKITY